MTDDRRPPPIPAALSPCAITPKYPTGRYPVHIKCHLVPQSHQSISVAAGSIDEDIGVDITSLPYLIRLVVPQVR